MSARAPLVLVVGPSGAGKDTLIAAARSRLAGDSGVVFARRWITRPADAGGEDHVEVALAAFDAAEAAGHFLLSWRAHGLAYGIPRDVERARMAGRAVVANVSRGVVEEARARLEPVAVFAIEVPDALLTARLRARGRESNAEVAARVARVAAPVGGDVTRIVNDGTVEEGVSRFVAALAAARAGA